MVILCIRDFRRDVHIDDEELVDEIEVVERYGTYKTMEDEVNGGVDDQVVRITGSRLLNAHIGQVPQHDHEARLHEEVHPSSMS